MKEKSVELKTRVNAIFYLMKACLILNILDDRNNKGKGIILNNEE